MARSLRHEKARNEAPRDSGVVLHVSGSRESNDYKLRRSETKTNQTKTMKTDIPDKFYKANRPQPKVSNVRELKKILSELPDDLPIRCGFSDYAEITVYNVGTTDEHLEITE